ncbi:MAG: InlB B-repeat-containing protein [Bacteroidales bacterium]
MKKLMSLLTVKPHKLMSLEYKNTIPSIKTMSSFIIPRLNRILFIFILQSLFLSSLLGQAPRDRQPLGDLTFSVLWNNVDLATKKLYIEIMYQKNSCFQDAAEFWIYSKNDAVGRPIKIDSLLNNANNCTISTDSFTLSNPTAGGYRLRFALSNADTVASDSVRIRVVSKYQAFFSCKGCGAAGSDISIESNSINPNCPYNNENYDLLACTQRTGGANNWEAFIIDHRDCKIYRAVAMPFLSEYNNGQGRWWLAQNLNYTKNLIMNKDAPTDGGLGTYWCMGSSSFGGVPQAVTSRCSTEVSGGETACKTYGAMYAHQTLMSRNGVSLTTDQSTEIDAWSIAQGICPIGWVVPGRKDFGVMFNKVAGCKDDDLAQTGVADNSIVNAPCHHLSNSPAGDEHHNPTGYQTNLPAILRSVLSSKKTLIDSVFITATNPVWPWYGVGSKRSHGSRAIDYYGFSAQPASSLHKSYLKFLNPEEGHTWSSTASATRGDRVLYKYDHNNIRTSSTDIKDAFVSRCVRDIFADQGDMEFDTYIIVYNANGGGGNAISEIFKGSSTIVPGQGTLKHPTKNELLGWSTSSTASTPQYAIGARFTPTANTTLYAVWDVKLTITQSHITAVTVTGAGAKPSGSNVTVTTSKSHSMLIFEGWYEGSNQVSSSTSYNVLNLTTNKTLEARYKVDGGEFPNANFRNWVVNRGYTSTSSSYYYTDNGKYYHKLNSTGLNLTKMEIINKSMEGNIKGIELFTKLEEVACYLSRISGEVDLSKNVALVAVQVFSNYGITSLKLPKNRKLRTLYGNENKLTTLDLMDVFDPARYHDYNMNMGSQGSNQLMVTAPTGMKDRWDKNLANNGHNNNVTMTWK